MLAVTPQVLISGLQGPWDLAQLASDEWLITNNTSNTITSFPAGVNISLNTTSNPGLTGIVYNPFPSSFIIQSNPVQSAEIILSTASGQLYAWNRNIGISGAAIQVYSNDNVSYQGLAIIPDPSGANFLYVANVETGYIDVFDDTFRKIFSFTDPGLLANGYYPYAIVSRDRQLYVSFVSIDSNGNLVSGAGLGYIDIFAPTGALLTRLISATGLNVPVGIAFPVNRRQGQGKGKCNGRGNGQGNILLVANNGDGNVNAFDLKTGAFIQTVTTIAGIRNIVAGTNGVFFVADNGTFGSLNVVRPGVNTAGNTAGNTDIVDPNVRGLQYTF